MSRCYICNREMLDPEKVGIKDTDKNGLCLKHGEHIIHNAIGGRLISSNILCKDCGEAYSQDDARFSKIFSPITVLLSQSGMMRTPDHSKAKTKPIKGDWQKPEGFHEDFPSDLEVKYQNDMVTPILPGWYLNEDKKEVVIYGDKYQLKDFRKKVVNEMKLQGKSVLDYHITEIADLKGTSIPLFYFSKGIDTFNEDMKRGLVKIALEFALDKGIAREDLTDVLSIDPVTGQGSVCYDNAVVIPYISLSIVDDIYENDREKYEGEYYPSHSLKLFTVSCSDCSDKDLCCFIDLFSTFQYYVILNRKYTGDDVSINYAHTLKRFKEKTIEDIDNYRWKDLSIIMQENNIPIDDVSGMDLEKVISHIKQRLQSRPADFPLDAATCSAYNWIKEEIFAYILQKMKPDYTKEVPLSDIAKSIIDTYIASRTLLPEDIAMLCDFQKDNYRIFYLEKSGSEYKILPYIAQCSDLYKNHPESITVYHTRKFSKLCDTCLRWAGFKCCR